jgi:hypothetical protein
MIQEGFYIALGWVSRAEMYFFDKKITSLPIQSDMNFGRQWLRPNNASDILYPSKIIDTPLGTRYAYGGLSFNWGLQNLSPKMTQYIQQTFFNTTIGNGSFYQSGYSNKLTVQTFNRGTGNWETYHTFAKFSNFNDEASPAAGGYNDLLIKFTAVKVAPDGPSVAIDSEYEDFTQMVYSNITFNLTNIGDTKTFDESGIIWSVPDGTSFVEIDNSNWDSLVYYSVNNRASWSLIIPSPPNLTTDIRIDLQEELLPEETTGNFLITIRPGEDTTSFSSEFFGYTNGDSSESGDNIKTDTIDVDVFQPNALSPVLWLDANFNVYEDYDSFPKLNATDGQPVQVWEDQSSGNRLYRQNTLSNQPILLTNQQNGLKAIQFDGINDILISTSFSGVSTTQNTTLIIVMDAINSNIDVGYEPIFANSSFNVWAHKSDDTSKTSPGIYVGNPPNTWLTSGLANSGFQICVYKTDATTFTFYRNAITVSTQLKSGNMYGIINSSLGGSNIVPTGNFEGKIYEVIGFNTTLSDNDRQAIEYYLINKYGV